MEKIRACLKKIYELLFNSNVAIVYRRPFYFRWLLQGNYFVAFLKVFLLFTIIWFIGYFITKSEGAHKLESGKVNLHYKSEACITDNIFIAGNILLFQLTNYNDSLLVILTRLTDQVNQNQFEKTTSKLLIKKTNTEEYSAENNVLLLGKHMKYSFNKINGDITLSFEIKAFGYLDDIPNYLMIAGLIAVFFMFRLLQEKFIYAFAGMDSDTKINEIKTNREEGLLRIIEFKADFYQYEDRINNVINKIALNYTEFIKSYIFLAIIYSIIVFYISGRGIFFSSIKEGNWNFTPDLYFKSYLYNQIKDLFIFIFLIGPLFFRVIIIFWFTFRLSYEFDQKCYYNINPVSFDNAGGLSPLGEVTLYLFYMFVAFFPHVYGAAYFLNFPTHSQILLPLYLIVTFLIFFVPLSSPHSSMKKAKKDELQKISEQYNYLNHKYLDKITKYQDAEFDDLYEKMNKVKVLYDEMKKMPVWPYDFEIFVKFGAVFITNLLLYFSQYLVNLLN